MRCLYARAPDGQYDLDVIHTDTTMLDASERHGDVSPDVLIDPRPGRVTLRGVGEVDAVVGGNGRLAVIDT